MAEMIPLRNFHMAPYGDIYAADLLCGLRLLLSRAEGDERRLAELNGKQAADSRPFRAAMGARIDLQTHNALDPDDLPIIRVICKVSLQRARAEFGKALPVRMGQMEEACFWLDAVCEGLELRKERTNG